MQLEPADASLEDESPDEPSRLTRIIWGVVVFLAAGILLGAVTLASITLLSPDAWEGPCKRPELVRPAPCSPVGNAAG